MIKKENNMKKLKIVVIMFSFIFNLSYIAKATNQNISINDIQNIEKEISEVDYEDAKPQHIHVPTINKTLQDVKSLKPTKKIDTENQQSLIKPKITTEQEQNHNKNTSNKININEFKNERDNRKIDFSKKLTKNNIFITKKDNNIENIYTASIQKINNPESISEYDKILLISKQKLDAAINDSLQKINNPESIPEYDKILVKNNENIIVNKKNNKVNENINKITKQEINQPANLLTNCDNLVISKQKLDAAINDSLKNLNAKNKNSSLKSNTKLEESLKNTQKNTKIYKTNMDKIMRYDENSEQSCEYSSDIEELKAEKIEKARGTKSLKHGYDSKEKDENSKQSCDYSSDMEELKTEKARDIEAFVKEYVPNGEIKKTAEEYGPNGKIRKTKVEYGPDGKIKITYIYSPYGEIENTYILMEFKN